MIRCPLGVEAGHDGQRGADGGVRECREVAANKGVLSDAEGTV